MEVTSTNESERLALQTQLDATKSSKERNRLGQFATPTDLATDVLAYARKLMPNNAAVRFLDPAIGTGSFYSALLREFSAQQIEIASGFEIDPHYEKPARTFWSGHALELNLADFTTARPPVDGARYNLIVCNPPYVRHHHMNKADKARLLSSTTAACGIQMAGLAGLYCYFLGLAHAWMEDDGIAGWLIPSEFMDVNYGIPVKRYLRDQVELIRVHRFDPTELQFGDALVSSAVVWFRKRKPKANHEVEFSFGGTLGQPKRTRSIPAVALRGAAKWSGLATNGMRATSDGLRLADFFSIKRGLATGDNNFFIMTRDQITSNNLTMEFFKPILPGPRHLTSDVIDAAADGIPKIDRQLFLLDCRVPETEIKVSHPALWDYLQTGKTTVGETYLCSRRKPWYAQENRPPAPIICTYMGRNMEKRDKPFRFILNRSQATAANVYLLLYPKPVLAKALAIEPELGRAVWEFLNGIDAATLLGEGRVYGGGLYKMEPRELANVPAQAIAALLPNKEDIPLSQSELFKGIAA